MLEILREKAAGEGLTPTVWEAGLRSVDAERAYALAVVLYNSFCSPQEAADQLAALEAIHDVLEPGGRLLFDVSVLRYDVVAETFVE